MKPTRLQRLLTIVDKALALEGEERTEFLNEVCGEDTVLRGEVGELLESTGASESFWEGWKQWNEQQIAGLFQGDGEPEGEPETEQRIGPWKLLRRLGRGGMGTVWLAERTDGSYEQQVALKLLHRGLETGESAHRFKQERQILARLDHPQIARLYDGGHTDDGLPWLAMEYIDGQPVTQWCDQQNCTLKQRLALFEEICGAIRYAHRNLIVHRDLKPENILVTNQGHIKILDFGIAKLLDEELSPEERIRTRTGVRAMSLDYAAPEQITGEPVTTATDVYALGLLLYELLTGGYPYDLEEKNLRQIEQIIRTDMPVRPSAFQTEGLPAAGGQELRGDLDAITLKALRKEPDGRYENAGQLLEDLHRFQRNQPVEARQGTMQYRVGKWIRRHRWTAASGLIVVLSLVLGIGVALWQAREADQAAEQATMALAETEQALSRAEALQEFLLDLFRSAEPNRPRDQLPTTEEILALGAERAMDEESAPPAERFSMLQTIGTIYGTQNRREEAKRLIEASVALAREHWEQRPEDLAQALFDLALVTLDEGDLTRYENLLLEAESLIEDSEAFWNMYAHIRTWRAWGERLKGNYEQALNLLEPLYGQMLEHHEVDESLREQIINFMAIFNHALGDLERASELYTDLSKIIEQMEGTESRDYAINLANSAEVERDLGRFDIAASRARQAIILYDQIFEQPMEYRASARRLLALTLLSMGHFEVALAELDTASTEWAQARGRDAATWEHRFLLRGRMLMRMHRWTEAEINLKRARNLFASLDDDQLITSITIADAFLAQALCLQEKTDEGKNILSELDTRLDGQTVDNLTDRALIYEARAICHFKAGSMEQALTEVDTALALETGYPGRVMHRVDRRILRARILATLGSQAEAAEELDKAEQAYLDFDLAGHPHFSLIEAARWELFGNDDL